jgi:hypothetical protein
MASDFRAAWYQRIAPRVIPWLRTGALTHKYDRIMSAQSELGAPPPQWPRIRREVPRPASCRPALTRRFASGHRGLIRFPATPRGDGLGENVCHPTVPSDCPSRDPVLRLLSECFWLRWQNENLLHQSPNRSDCFIREFIVRDA